MSTLSGQGKHFRHDTESSTQQRSAQKRPSSRSVRRSSNQEVRRSAQRPTQRLNSHSARRPAQGRSGDRYPYERNQGGQWRRTLSNVLLVVGAICLCAAVGMFGYRQWRYWKQDKVNEALAEYVTLYDDAAPTVDWEALEAINPEVVGWIYIPGTVINYPVYQTSDNEYYLEYNAYGEAGVGGQVFLDYENTAPGMIDAQSLLYGHHLRNGAMFKSIADMDSRETFDAVQTVWYITREETFELKPLLIYYTTPDDSSARTVTFASEEEFHAYLLELLAKSQVSADGAEQTIALTDHVLTLSTCNYINGYGRTLLVCVPKDTNS